MPLEIKELHIKIAVEEGGAGNAAGGASNSTGDGGADEATIQACVEKVLEILKEKAER
jgi:Family of unknown function (DUF5908)